MCLIGRRGQQRVPRQVAVGGGAGLGARRRGLSTASTSCRTVKIVGAHLGAPRACPDAAARAPSAAPRAPSSPARDRARDWRRGGTVASDALASMTDSVAARASARPATRGPRPRRSGLRRASRRWSRARRSNLMPPDFAGRGPRQRLERDVVGQDALVRGQLDRQPLELEPHELAQIDDAALAQHLLVRHDDRVQPLGCRLLRPARGRAPPAP